VLLPGSCSPASIGLSDSPISAIADILLAGTEEENRSLPIENQLPPNKDQFESALALRFQNAEAKQLPYIEVKSGDLHREIGNYPGTNHRMPVCCGVMRNAMKTGDAEIASPPKGQGASLVIRYRLPRNA
jgi:hypothetical protein